MSPESNQLATRTGFAVTLIILGCLIISCAISAHAFMELKADRKLARQRVLQLSELWIDLESAESAQRGYLLTGDASYVAPFDVAHRQKTIAIGKLHGLFPIAHPAQGELDALDAILERKFIEMEETVRVMQTGNLPCALAIVKSDYGEHLRNEADVIYRRLKETSDTELEALRNAGEALLSRGFWTVGCACLLAMAALSAAMAVVSADLAKRRRIEAELRAANVAAQQATAAKSMFLATMSHELRTPLNAICGMSDFLLEGQLSPEQRRFAEVIARSAMALLSLVNDILDFSKIEAGRLEMENTPFATAALFKSQLEIVRHLAESKDLVLRQEIDPAIPPYLRGDAGRIGQVILNLLSNALKFTHAGSVTARFVALPDSDTLTTALRVEVVDTGIGMSDEQMSRLFLPFSQVHNAPQATYGGTGLGLAICRQLVDLMGGSIGVRKNPEGGCIFWITVRLPVAQALPAEAAITRQLTAAADGALPRPSPIGNILVAEDNAVNQLLIVKQLERLGYRSQVVHNGAEALAALTNQTFDLVLMDCQMPEMDGYEAARRIRAREQLTGTRVPIVALTASAIRGDAERCVEAGMDGHLTKPVNKDLLAQTIKAWVAR